jgi:hypothetical protein
VVRAPSKKECGEPKSNYKKENHGDEVQGSENMSKVITGHSIKEKIRIF